MTTRIGTLLPLAAALLLTTTACETETETDVGAADTLETTTTGQTAERPDTTGAATWSYLQQENYAESWAFWPDKEPFYEGTEPHGALLNTYLNEAAAGVVNAGGGDFPDGSILVKENYMPDSSLAAVTVMHKVDGYNPEHNDWFWAKFSPDGSIEAEGKVESCQSCHMGEGDGNYIMTGDL